MDKDMVINLRDVPTNLPIWLSVSDFLILDTQEIIKYLDRFVVGQDKAKQMVAYIAANHIGAELHNDTTRKEDKVISTSLLLTGPSGSGKTYMLKKLAEKMGRPFLSVDITHFSPTGYVGKNVHSILEELLTISGDKVDRAESGIVLIDEVDKISGYANNGNSFSSTSIQRSLLKMVEGDKIEVDKRVIDTSKILWIFAGSFDTYITDKKKTSSKQTVGFGSPKPKKEKVTLDHVKLVELGMLREFVGRIGHIAELDELDDIAYKKILTEVEGSPIRQLRSIAAARGKELKVTDADIKQIVKKARALGVGARGLRVITEQYFMDQLL